MIMQKWNNMRIGSIVEVVGNFEEERRTWGFPYPKTGDILTVSSISPHPNSANSKKGMSLLFFEELPTLTGISDKRSNGKLNFVELLLPDDIEELLKEPLEQKCVLMDKIIVNNVFNH